MDPSVLQPMQESAENPGVDCSDRYFEYRKLLDDISQRLLKENALRLANLYELPSWYFEIGPSHDPSYALRVMVALEGKGVYSPGNCAGLADALKHIEREDLCTVVKDFIRKKSEEGLTQERIRRQTHPQPSPSPYMYRRGLNSSFSHQPSTLNPRLFSLLNHSTSFRSLTGDPSLATNQSDIPRSQSKPILSVIGGDASIETDHVPPQPSSLLVEHGDSALSLQILLIGARSLNKQLSVIARNYPTIESSPVKVREPALLLKAVLASGDLVSNLEQAIQIENPLSSQLFSQSSSFNEMSRMSSHCSDGIDIKKVDASFQKEPASLFENGKSKPKKKRNLITAPPCPEAIHPSPPSPGATMQIAASTSPPSSVSSSVPSITVYRGINRRWSRKEEKKMSKHGILMWHLKVKKLRRSITQQDIRIDSDDFYDRAKRSMKATLCPYGLGDDAGNHMTLLIHCLDEPKSNFVPNMEIVVNILDPQSDSPTLPVEPIRRSLERRGIRVVQRFVAHSQIEHFKSSYVTITVAVVETESDASDLET